MKVWSKITIRGIALANILLGVMGLILQIDGVTRFAQRYQPTAARPYETYAFWTMAGICLVFELLSVLSGFLLWRLGRPALKLCNWLFASELLYLIGNSMVVVVLVASRNEWAHGLSISIAAARGIGEVGLGPQLLSLYPVWALVLLNLSYWHMRKARPSVTCEEPPLVSLNQLGR